MQRPTPSPILPPSFRAPRAASRARRALALAAALALPALAAAWAPGGLRAQPSGDEPAPALLPCDPVVEQQVDRLSLAEGETLQVTTRWRYRCERDRQRRVNFFLVVENTSALRGSGVSRALLGNLKDALQQFVLGVDFDGGSRGGLSLYAQDVSQRVTLRGGRDGEAALLRAIRGISTEPIGNSAGAPAAIRDATELLPTGQADEDVRNVLVVVDAGAPVITRPLIDYQTACGAARDAGVTLVIVGLETAGARGAGCASRGWFRASRDEDGEDLRGIFDELAEQLLSQDKSVESEELVLLPSPAFAYVEGSGEPRDPDLSFAGMHSWSYAGEHAPEERVLRYRLRARPDSATRGARVPLTDDASLLLLYADGLSGLLPLPVPEVCIHAAGDAEACAARPDLPTPTEAAPPTATPVTPTATALPPASPTAPPTVAPTDPPAGAPARIYMPALHRGHG